jgi:hypothetical protein
MFWITMYLLFFGGSTAAEWSFAPGEKEIRQTVDDPRRQERAAAILEEIKSAERVLFDTYESRVAEYAELSLRHDADMETLRDITAGLEEARVEAQGAWLDSRFSLKNHLTREEWERA